MATTAPTTPLSRRTLPTSAGTLGPSEPIDGRPDPQAGDLDLAELESLGGAWGEFSVEESASLGPELLISNMFPPPDLWFADALENAGKLG
ncbi:hypothetical protein AA958_16695 [Streptomyces sp. CNQ-509]|uniref:hypothetical protein n=1 Tax=unclassified Streptomyces TaxID=2593676 RepID=UPI00062DE14A|nr:hypothetical protein [Streptomyces sp. CNQ-509]AKH83577.1 hypothetical protein AA958_16695 [Streptomyces sp. CNQ-509]